MIARAGDEGQGRQGGAQKWRSMPAAADIGRRLQICKGFRGLRAREVKAPGGEAHPCGRVRKKGRTATPTAHESASRSLLQPSPCRNCSAVRAEILQNSLVKFCRIPSARCRAAPPALTCILVVKTVISAAGSAQRLVASTCAEDEAIMHMPLRTQSTRLRVERLQLPLHVPEGGSHSAPRCRMTRAAV